MKQPFEDVHGYSREQDDLLSLEESALPRRAMMIALAKHLERATLVGNPAPIVQRMYERISSPGLGDLVVESSAMRGRGRAPDSQVKGFGILIERRVEWAATDEAWEAAVREEGLDFPEPRPTDEAWYVLYGPRSEDVCRWTNCSFLVIPTDPGMFPLLPAGTPTTEITRDDLVAGLGDSGFGLKR